MSPTSQNEMIEVIGRKIILRDIVEEIRKSGFHGVSADEVTSSNDEILSLSFSLFWWKYWNPRIISSISRSWATD